MPQPRKNKLKKRGRSPKGPVPVFLLKEHKSWFLYIVQCQDKTLYTGITTDITRRVKEHNAKRGAFYTKNKIPVKLVYQEFVGNCRSDALKREFQIKRMERSQKVQLIKSS